MANKQKEIIGMCHFLELPGDIKYNFNSGIHKIIDRARHEIYIMQNNGITKILFSNEFSYPYTAKLDDITVLSMANIIGMLKKELSVPFGVDCMYDSVSTINLAVATDADFYRISLPDSTQSDYLYGRTDIGTLMRYAAKYSYSPEKKLLLNISEMIKNATDENDIISMISCVITQIMPNSLCFSAKNYDLVLNAITHYGTKDILGSTEIYCDGGCNSRNIPSILKDIDGLVIGAAFKGNENITNSVDERNVKKSPR